MGLDKDGDRGVEKATQLHKESGRGSIEKGNPSRNLRSPFPRGRRPEDSIPHVSRRGTLTTRKQAEQPPGSLRGRGKKDGKPRGTSKWGKGVK